jgi:hypothetical protein
MCEPVTLGIAIGATVLAGGVKAYGEYQQGEAAAKAAQQQATMERAAAADALQRGATEQGRARTAGSQAIGENVAALAAAGVDVQAGSAGASLADTRSQSELDVGTIRSNAARAAWGHDVQAGQLDYSAKNARYQAKLAMAGTFLGTAASVASIAGAAPKGAPAGAAPTASGMGGPTFGAEGYYVNMPTKIGR